MEYFLILKKEGADDEESFFDLRSFFSCFSLLMSPFVEKPRKDCSEWRDIGETSMFFRFQKV